ncbi:MAG TPA: hypothetical protein VFR49_13290 [Solirubrobacteraceae bacterium]|nr:hypothetical protein [Solirubrobacteraceae bacterium]
MSRGPGAAGRFAARTRLPAEWPATAAAVDAGLESCRRRWNQYGVETVIEVAGDRHGVTVRYRLVVSGHPDPSAVHAAFRGDLDDALRPPTRAAAPPDDWDLEAMARLCAAAAAGPPAPELVYEPDVEPGV